MHGIEMKGLPDYRSVPFFVPFFAFFGIIGIIDPSRFSLAKAMSRASNPRVRQPSTSTGVKATTKKTSGRVVGRRI